MNASVLPDLEDQIVKMTWTNAFQIPVVMELPAMIMLTPIHVLALLVSQEQIVK